MATGAGLACPAVPPSGMPPSIPPPGVPRAVPPPGMPPSIPPPGVPRAVPPPGMPPSVPPSGVPRAVPPPGMPPSISPQDAAPLPAPASSPAFSPIYIGGIPEHVCDAAMRSLLSIAGNVVSWHRARAPAVPGSKVRFAPFGICMYEDEASALRAVRLLGRVQIELPRTLATQTTATGAELKRGWKRMRTESRAEDNAVDGGVTDIGDDKPCKRFCSLFVRMDSRFVSMGVNAESSNAELAHSVQSRQGADDTEVADAKMMTGNIPMPANKPVPSLSAGSGDDGPGNGDTRNGPKSVAVPVASQPTEDTTKLPNIDNEMADDDAKTLDLMQQAMKYDTLSSLTGDAEAESGPLDSDGECDSNAAYVTLYGCEPKTELDAGDPLNEVQKFRRANLRRGIELERWRLKQVRRCVDKEKTQIRARQRQERRQSMEQHVGMQLAQIAPAAVPADTTQIHRKPREQAMQPISRHQPNIKMTKAELFATAINWSAIDQCNVTERVVRPWVVKQITTYLGEAEKTLIDFVLQQLAKRSAATDIEQELAMVLEQDEAERFVIQLWRILVENS